MWMMTKIGFFSIVEKPKDLIQIRSRVFDDLVNFKEKILPGVNCKIIETPHADYNYRVVVPRVVFQDHFDNFAKLVTYDNFKSEVGKTNKYREQVYHNVWWTLMQIQNEEE